MKHPYLQSIITISALISLVLLTDPFMTLMPTPAQMAVLIGVSVLLILSVAFILTEEAHDEREELHRLEAGRLAYASGLSFLIIGLLVQGFTHTIDPWLVLTIAVMLVVKVAVRLYDNFRK